MDNTKDYLETLCTMGEVNYGEVKEFFRLITGPSSLLTRRIRISRHERISYLREHPDVDILKEMKLRKIKIVDALWAIGNTPYRLGDAKPEFIFRKDAISTFHLDSLGERTDLGLRFSINLESLSCGFARDVHFNQPEWIELEFTGVHFHASK
ncbi:hypothetical protein TOTORO_01330 [Serratia phage vB_SmaS-Totoro]|nr:hypothetical protein TOTORO_01330 [Serratia phage vB_SmaS-Totoro]